MTMAAVKMASHTTQQRQFVVKMFFFVQNGPVNAEELSMALQPLAVVCTDI
jgi:hypothetical protein